MRLEDDIFKLHIEFGYVGASGQADWLVVDARVILTRRVLYDHTTYQAELTCWKPRNTFGQTSGAGGHRRI